MSIKKVVYWTCHFAHKHPSRQEAEDCEAKRDRRATWLAARKAESTGSVEARRLAKQQASDARQREALRLRDELSLPWKDVASGLGLSVSRATSIYGLAKRRAVNGNLPPEPSASP